MRLELTGRQVEITPILRKKVEKKLAKLDRLLKGGIVSVQAVLAQEKYMRRAEITVHTTLLTLALDILMLLALSDRDVRAWTRARKPLP